MLKFLDVFPVMFLLYGIISLMNKLKDFPLDAAGDFGWRVLFMGMQVKPGD